MFLVLEEQAEVLADPVTPSTSNWIHWMNTHILTHLRVTLSRYGANLSGPYLRVITWYLSTYNEWQRPDKTAEKAQTA